MLEEQLLVENLNEKDENEIKNLINGVRINNNKKKVDHIIRVTNFFIKKKMQNETIFAWIIQNLPIEKQEILQNYSFKNNIKLIITECKRIQEVIDNNYNKMPPETLISLILSLATDMQTIIIKMVEINDLLKNPMEKNCEKLVFIAKNVYSPLTTKLGISDLNCQINDNCFKLEKPTEYEKIKKLVNKTREEREQIIKKIIEEIEILLKDKINAQIFGRPKNFLSIYEKMKKVSFKKMYDIYGIRIICNKEKECYEILGNIHEKYNFIREAFDDYIAKEGKGIGKKGYQSIHTAIKRNEDVIEIQIRTWQQHLRTESSIYWEYKRLRKNKEFDNKLSWERQLIEWQKSIGEENKNKRIVGEKIFAFTPKNKIISLPENSTAIDFAFAVHTDIGKKAKQAKINGVLVSIETKLKNLDKIEIITDKKNTIKQTWLNSVESEKAKSKIKNYFKIKTIKKENKIQITQEKKIKMAECCNPLPGEDVIGVKTTKRKIIIHKKNCENIKKIPKNKLIEIFFEKAKGTTKIKVNAIDRIGLLGEILGEFKKNKIKLLASNFKIKNTGYVEAIFEIEVKNIQNLEKIIKKLKEINSIQSIERK
ncbi:MAG: TGS domain-containing protein [Candidatus ainarchaeum sp.]|nr:TGS domain-containing protein [Candidatus ainarchaeum sp.]